MNNKHIQPSCKIARTNPTMCPCEDPFLEWRGKNELCFKSKLKYQSLINKYDPIPNNTMNLWELNHIVPIYYYIFLVLIELVLDQITSPSLLLGDNDIEVPYNHNSMG